MLMYICQFLSVSKLLAGTSYVGCETAKKIKPFCSLAEGHIFEFLTKEKIDKNGLDRQILPIMNCMLFIFLEASHSKDRGRAVYLFLVEALLCCSLYEHMPTESYKCG